MEPTATHAEDKSAVDEIKASSSTPDSDNKPLRLLELVKGNVREGQKQKGKLTMQDCRLLTQAEDVVTKFLTLVSSPNKGKEEAEKNVYATEQIYNAFRIILASLEILQTTGIFTVEGSGELLEAMEEISAVLDEHRDPVLKMRDLKEKVARAGGKKKKNPK
jgi:hypothetical protein